MFIESLAPVGVLGCEVLSTSFSGSSQYSMWQTAVKTPEHPAKYMYSMNAGLFCHMAYPWVSSSPPFYGCWIIIHIENLIGHASVADWAQHSNQLLVILQVNCRQSWAWFIIPCLLLSNKIGMCNVLSMPWNLFWMMERSFSCCTIWVSFSQKLSSKHLTRQLQEWYLEKWIVRNIFFFFN